MKECAYFLIPTSWDIFFKALDEAIIKSSILWVQADDDRWDQSFISINSMQTSYINVCSTVWKTLSKKLRTKDLVSREQDYMFNNAVWGCNLAIAFAYEICARAVKKCATWQTQGILRKHTCKENMILENFQWVCQGCRSSYCLLSPAHFRGTKEAIIDNLVIRIW